MSRQGAFPWPQWREHGRLVPWCSLLLERGHDHILPNCRVHTWCTLRLREDGYRNLVDEGLQARGARPGIDPQGQFGMAMPR